MTSKLCVYRPSGDHYACVLCGDTTGNPDLRRVCPLLRSGKIDHTWTCGVTTVAQRVEDGTLADTLTSIIDAGFPQPRIFCDGAANIDGDVTYRIPRTNAFSNWMLAAWELYLRHPHSKYYAIFQDDCVVARNTRRYLDTWDYPERGYWNLYTHEKNGRADMAKGWHPASKRGFGALGLVFDNTTLKVLLTHEHMINRPKSPVRGGKNIDGGIVTALKQAGWTEYVHMPSLMQHIGDKSTLGHSPRRRSPYFEPVIPIGLGDMTGGALASIGITEQRYKHAKQMIGLRGDCRCKERREKLNKLWDGSRGNQKAQD